MAAPGKTIADCVRVRLAQRAAAAAALPVPAKAPVPPASNAVVMAGPRFGLTEEDVRAALPDVRVEIAFLPSDEGVLRPLHAEGLAEFKSQVIAAVEAASLGGAVGLCTVDAALHIVARESETASADGWSRVAAKGAAPRRLVPVPPPGGANTFSALSGRVTFAKKKKPVAAVEVVDDWEQEMEREEQKAAAVDEEKTEAAGEEVIESGDEEAKHTGEEDVKETADEGLLAE